MEHELEYIALYVQKHTAHLAIYYNLPLIRDKPLGAAAFVRRIYWEIIRLPSDNDAILKDIGKYITWIINHDDITITKQSTTEPRIYVCGICNGRLGGIILL